MVNNVENVKKNVIATIITDWCTEKAKNNLISFNNSLVSSYQKFRFLTPITEKVFPSNNTKKGFWNNGIFTLYEIQNNDGNISVSFLISTKDLKN